MHIFIIPEEHSLYVHDVPSTQAADTSLEKLKKTV